MKKIMVFLLSFVLCFALFGCANNDNTPDQGDQGNITDDTGNKPNQGDNTGDNKGDDDKNPEKPERGVMDNLVLNFWETDTMYDETIMLVAQTDALGNVTGAPKAKLLLASQEILSVKQYYHESNGGQIKTFKEGTDFEYSDGYITAKGESVTQNGKTTFNTTMPYVTDKQVSGHDTFPGTYPSNAVPSVEDGIYLPFTESHQIVQMQLSVTYKHAVGAWKGATPSYCGDKLKRTVDKLNKQEKIELLIYGDSISTGANCSSFLKISPQLPSWMELFRANLAAYYKSEVVLTNKAVGGWTSTDGVNGGAGTIDGKYGNQIGLSAQFNSNNGSLKGYVPDIAVIGFGMNDATLGVTKDRYVKNIKNMIFTLREVNPNCDIILVGTMLANPDAKAHNKNQAEYSELLYGIADSNDGVAVVNVGLMHKDILQAGKRFIELSGNNVNHPNDFMTRVYAMHMLSALVKD